MMTGVERGGGFTPLVTVVDFHHARGPECEAWFGAEEGQDPAKDYGWEYLPFMALTDGAHATTEDFSYFTLLRPATSTEPATSLFGISCTMQIDASLLIDRPPEVTRSTVQKAVVVIADSPQFFGMLRQRLSIVTGTWFAQRDFTDMDILDKFQESLKAGAVRGKLSDGDDDRDQYLGMSLRSLIREFRWQTLVLFKCCLLQPKMLFFGSRCERLCMIQFSLISLIPGLIRHLQDCAATDLDSYERNLVMPDNVKTSDRTSLLAYMGVPLQIFGKGSLFGPYTPLQQLDTLADVGTKSYIVGSTNSLLLQQKDRYSDILINLDEDTINITSPSLRSALSLSIADRRWIDFITQSVNDSWDDENPNRPTHHGYVGSEEFIRLQFEEYLLSLLSSIKCQEELQRHPGIQVPGIDGDPAYDYNLEWVEAWKKSENFRIWHSKTDRNLFDFVEAKHPCAGGLTIEDVKQRVTQQVAELHLDERFEDAKVVLGQNLAAGREGANRMFNRIYENVEALKIAQRRRQEEAKIAAEKQSGSSPTIAASYTPDLAKAQAVAQSVKSSAGSYVSGWGSWIGEKRKTGWGRASVVPAIGPEMRDIKTKSDLENEPMKTTETDPTSIVVERPRTRDSYTESVFDAEHLSPLNLDEHWSQVVLDKEDHGGQEVDAALPTIADEEAEKARAAFK